MHERGFLRFFGAATFFCALCSIGCSKKTEAPSEPEPPLPAAAPGVQQTKIIVNDKGFTPSHVDIAKGKPASLVFVRMTDDTCATQVVFPELKLEKELPLRTPVAIDLPTTDARTVTFQCGMGMYKSAVVVQ
jgi:plastocyanin domain-containing protein